MAEVLLITALVLALFFIFFIRPARQVQGRRRRDLNDLRIGDEVLISGGLIATVDAVETPPHGPMILHLEIDDGVVLRARTSAIEQRLRTADEVAADEVAADGAGPGDLRQEPAAGLGPPSNDSDAAAAAGAQADSQEPPQQAAGG